MGNRGKRRGRRAWRFGQRGEIISKEAEKRKNSLGDKLANKAGIGGERGGRKRSSDENHQKKVNLPCGALL